MFRDESITNVSEWSWNQSQAVRADRHERHREIDAALRRIASQRCGLDVEEARWLRAAEDDDIWQKLGYVHGLEYVEDVFGYRPRTAKIGCVSRVSSAIYRHSSKHSAMES